MLSLLQTQMGRFRVLAFAEGVSLLIIIFVTMPLKYMADMPLPNKIFGLAHGVLFILYVVAVILIKVDYKWSFKKMLIALVAAVIPFGTFWADKKYFKDETEVSS